MIKISKNSFRKYTVGFSLKVSRPLIIFEIPAIATMAAHSIRP